MTNHIDGQSTTTTADHATAWDAFIGERRLAISNAYVSGDGSPLAEILTSEDPATFFPPSGARVAGARAVADAQLSGASSFAPGSKGTFEILSSGTSGDLAWWAGVHRATVHLAGKDEPVDMALRTSEVFRFEDGDWKLVHRHADMIDDA